MRKVLVTGLGGAGRTTTAAATALAAALHGRRTLFLSADPGDVLGTPVTAHLGEPAEVTDGLWAARIEPGADFRAEFLNLQERSSAAFDLLGARPLEDEELTELPGSEQFALLRALTVAARGDWDVLVVDMPTLYETIALLALPEQLRRYLRRLLPPERQAARALRPMLAQLAGVPMPAQWLYETAERWDTELAGVQSVIESRNTNLTVVAEPGPAAADAVRTARAGMALHGLGGSGRGPGGNGRGLGGSMRGLGVDMIVANRIVPRDSADTWLAGLAAQQQKCLDEWHHAWAVVGPAPVCEVRHLGRDPRGLDDLTLLQAGSSCAPVENRFDDDASELVGLHELHGLTVALHWDREERREDPWRVEEPADDSTFSWHLDLPGAVKEELSLVRRGDELLITVGLFRRIVPLPSALRRCTVAGAGLTDDVLSVRFTPDPGLWPRAR
ncbi:ArsA family ATPase [Streptomyces sp. NBC_01142]|uniref:ArsA family ATPase n=1 Tax=Streptomyces sp. NBC_01142 TaxID=2975865 RepID=UPI002257B8F8|nr:ArsA-related P-loop ATPase [Streptomyces sp. NBC_01142]MCX4822520.1 ArsA family ATPase [Streptomyces sp. NBC_01142]